MLEEFESETRMRRSRTGAEGERVARSRSSLLMAYSVTIFPSFPVKGEGTQA